MISFSRKGNLGRIRPTPYTATVTVRSLKNSEPLLTTSNDQFCLPTQIHHFPSPLVKYRVSELSEITYIGTDSNVLEGSVNKRKNTRIFMVTIYGIDNHIQRGSRGECVDGERYASLTDVFRHESDCSYRSERPHDGETLLYRRREDVDHQHQELWQSPRERLQWCQVKTLVRIQDE
jgi:hypothetical protein